MKSDKSDASRTEIFSKIKAANAAINDELGSIESEALALLDESQYARPKLLSQDALQAFMLRIEAGLVIGTTVEQIAKLDELPQRVKLFLGKYSLAPELKVQDASNLAALDWENLKTDVDIQQDNTVGLCWAQYGIAETGSFVVHSSPQMPILLNFLPLYLIAVIPQSKILHYMDDYALIANDIASAAETPRNMCIISGVSGTTDIEGVLVQGAHGPEILHIIIVKDL